MVRDIGPVLVRSKTAIGAGERPGEPSVLARTKGSSSGEWGVGGAGADIMPADPPEQWHPSSLASCDGNQAAV